MLSGGYTGAMKHIKDLLAKKPDDPEMLTKLGECQARTGENKKARHLFGCHQVFPRQVDAYFDLALLLHAHPELTTAAESRGAANEKTGCQGGRRKNRGSCRGGRDGEKKRRRMTPKERWIK